MHSGHNNSADITKVTAVAKGEREVAETSSIGQTAYRTVLQMKDFSYVK